MLDTGWLHSSLKCSQLWGEAWLAATAQSNTIEQFTAGSTECLILFCRILLQLHWILWCYLWFTHDAKQARLLLSREWKENLATSIAMPCSLCHPASQRCDCVQNLYSTEEGKSSRDLTGSLKQWMICRYHPHKSHIQNKNSPSLHSLFQRVLSAQTFEGHPGQHRTKKGLLKSRANMS